MLNAALPALWPFFAFTALPLVPGGLLFRRRTTRAHGSVARGEKSTGRRYSCRYRPIYAIP